MGVTDGIREFMGFGPSKSTRADLALEQAHTMAQEASAYVGEGLMTMLSIALEDRPWIEVDGYQRDRHSSNLSFAAIKKASRDARALITGNPVMRAAALARVAYVLSEPVRFDNTGKVLKNKRNLKNVFGTTALIENMMSKMADGNLLIVIENGREAFRIPFYEIQGAIYNPQDPSEIYYFYRVWKEVRTNFDTGLEETRELKMLYPNREYERGGVPHSPYIRGVEVYQYGTVKHIAANRLVGQAWGVPDMLAGIFYAAEHKELVEAADSIYRAQSQYAIQYKSKSRKGLEAVAAHLASPTPVDPRTGEAAEYGQSIAFGGDIEMQLMSKIGSGINFQNFDPIAALASSVLGIPVAVILGTETPGKELAATTLRLMKIEQLFWDEAFKDILEDLGRPEAKSYWPPIDPDATHRQVQSIVGAAALKIVSPEEVRTLLRETFGADWEEKLPDPEDWEPFVAAKVAPGSTEVSGGGTITPGQGQTGKLGKLADGDHELRDAGEQSHTEK